MELFNYWMYGVVVFGVLMALTCGPHAEARMMFRAVILWPLTVPIVAVVLLFDLVGWEFDAMRSKKMFGFRRPNDDWPGFALTVFYIEIQFWKARSI